MGVVETLVSTMVTVLAATGWDPSAAGADMAQGSSWSLSVAERGAYYSAAAYCSDDYLTHDFVGVLSGFVPTYHIYYKKFDVQGYIGYLPSQNEIAVVYRGSNSLQNWIENLEFKKVDYPYCDGCEVHDGFYKGSDAVRDDVVAEVARLKALYPSYTVFVTGHSLGAALATLTAMDLYRADLVSTSDRIYNFGSPRVGNEAFADYASTTISNLFRTTHDADVVVHIPPYNWNYHHCPLEMWQEGDTVDTIVQCDGSGEDPNCADSKAGIGENVDDHCEYLEIPICTCDAGLSSSGSYLDAPTALE